MSGGGVVALLLLRRWRTPQAVALAATGSAAAHANTTTQVIAGQASAETQRWTAIGVGLAIGLFAKYALRLQDGQRIGWRELLIDILLLGVNALLASIAVQRFNLHGQEAMAVAALFGAGNDRIVRLVRNKFIKRVEQAAQLIMADPGEDVRVPREAADTIVRMPARHEPREEPIANLRRVLPLEVSASELERWRDIIEQIDEARTLRPD